MESFSLELQNLITQIVRKNGITNYTVDVNKSISKEGDGYIGILSGVSVIDKDSDKKLNLVIKRAPSDENLRKQFPIRSCFLREIRMYDEVFPDLLKFQEEYNIPDPFKAVTKLHGYIIDEFKETLLLENLKEHGYALSKRQEPLDSHHLSLVITEYAKLHAISHAMKKLQSKTFEKIVDFIGVHIMQEFQQQRQKKEGQNTDSAAFGPIGNEADVFFDPAFEALKDRPDLLDALRKFKEKCFQIIFANQKKGEHDVVSHGDCWSANLLFKYEDEDKPKIPTKLCIIDWQMSLISTPIHDLSYFFYISAGKNDLNNYMRYLHLYHTALSESLIAFGLDPKKVYSFELLEKEFKENSRIGFFMCLIMMQQTLTEGKTHDFEELAKEGKSIFDVNHREVQISDLFKQRMVDLLEFLTENDFI